MLLFYTTKGRQWIIAITKMAIIIFKLIYVFINKCIQLERPIIITIYFNLIFMGRNKNKKLTDKIKINNFY
jgi:hypothetical protein